MDDGTAGFLMVMMVRKKRPAAAGSQINETFSTGSTATDANFTNVANTASISGGVLTSTSDWKGQHNTDLGSPNHWVEADFIVGTYNGDSGICVRQAGVDTKYRLHAAGGRWRIQRSVAGADTALIIHGSEGPSNSTTYRLRLEVTGTGATVTLTAYVDGVQKLTYDDTSGSRITSGNKVGASIYTGGDGAASLALDNFEADVL